MLTSDKKICPMCEGCGYLCVRTGEENSSSMSSQDLVKSWKMKERRVVSCSNVASGNSRNDKLSKNNHPSPDRFGTTTDHVSTLDNNFLGDAEKFVNTQETLRLVVQKLRENNWESSVSALLNVVHLSRINPESIDSSMPLITRSLHGLMRNVRPQVARTACQIAEELFKTMQCSQKPEFDELVSTLLQKTSHMSKAVREDANRALDAMVLYIPASHCISVMSGGSGARHKNPIVRTTVSRLLYNIVRGIGVETFLTASNLRDPRARTFLMCIEFLNDPNTETRCNARRLMQLLMRHSDFEQVFGQDVERATIEKIEKQLITLKYEESPVN